MQQAATSIKRFSFELDGNAPCIIMPGLGPNLPHVGIKESGVGCDRSLWSLDEFFSIRRISIRP